MGSILTAVILFTSLGLVCALTLIIASKAMHVPVDERVAQMREHMPGANCGACGYSGCDAYATALVKGNVSMSLCAPGGDKLVEHLASILGTAPGESVHKRFAVVHCMGDRDTARNKMEYVGIRTCIAAKQLFGGQGACTFGCIGYGDCTSACLNDAICIENGLARIDTRKCNGCGLCVKACPNGVITTQYEPVTVAVMCMNTERGAQLKDKCSSGCIGCTRCVRECPSEAISVNDSLASIDYDRCTGCGKCAEVCVKKCISA